jgi:hypothetical protein
MRYYCNKKEQQRQKVYEKALDVCATSPFARGVQRWVLSGMVPLALAQGTSSTSDVQRIVLTAL